MCHERHEKAGVEYGYARVETPERHARAKMPVGIVEDQVECIGMMRGGEAVFRILKQKRCKGK